MARPAAANRIGDPLSYLSHLATPVEAEAETTQIALGVGVIPPLISLPFFSPIRLATGPWLVSIDAPTALQSRQRRRLAEALDHDRAEHAAAGESRHRVGAIGA